MYEPYAERKRFKVDWEGLKEKIKEKASVLKSRKWAAVIIALIVIGGGAGYTGFVTYTSKINELNSTIMILDKQLKSCQNDVASCNSELESTESELSTYIAKHEKCESDLEATQSSLATCRSEKEDLKAEYSTIKSDLETCQSDLEQTEEELTDLEEDIEDLECEFAKRVCGSIGFDYYFVDEDNEIICCVKEDPDYCGETAPSKDVIERITC